MCHLKAESGFRHEIQFRFLLTHVKIVIYQFVH